MNNNNLDFNNFLDIINKFQDDSRDKDIIIEMINNIRKYDVFDFISKVSSLNLIPDNQNNSLLFDTMIGCLLSYDASNFSTKIKMSQGQFNSIMSKLESLSICRNIDPCENAFIERVLFYENYYIFPGINYSPSYILQGFINVLRKNENDFDEGYVLKSNKLINMALQISNAIVDKIDYKFEHIKHYSESRKILFPSSKKLEKVRSAVVFDANIIKLLIADEELYDNLICDFGSHDLNNVLSTQVPYFYSKPLLKNDDKLIILNPSILASCVIHHIILLSAHYGLKDKFLNLYHEESWKDCNKSLKDLGHQKIIEKDIGIELYSASNYREQILNVGNDQLLVLHFICDDGVEYTETSMFGEYKRELFGDLLINREEYLRSQLKLNNVLDVYQILIISALGRRMGITHRNIYKHNIISLSPFELKCVSINERNRYHFLPRYISSKDKVTLPVASILSELNSIEVYVGNDYSFYVNDDFDPENGILYIAPGDSIDYVIRAMKKENLQLVQSYDEDKLVEVIMEDSNRQIYSEKNNRGEYIALLLKLEYLSIWVCSPSANNELELNCYFSIVDALTFWLAECKKIIDKDSLLFNYINLNVELSTDINEFYTLKELEQNMQITDYVTSEIIGNNLNITWTPEAYQLLNSPTNKVERDLIRFILQKLENLLQTEFDLNLLNICFENNLKKKFFSIDYSSNPSLKPVINKFHKIPTEYEDILLDEVGKHLLSKGEWHYGRVNDIERSKVANEVVSYLYNKLTNIIVNINPIGFYEKVYFDLELVLYNLLLTQKRYSYDIACYPENAEQIQNEFNELNKSSRALKFLIEYISACPPEGNTYLGELLYYEILAICSLIINWAYRNDLFYYNIFNTPVEFLPSGRIGMKMKEHEDLFMLNKSASERKLIILSNPDINSFFPYKLIPDLKDKINECFLDEYTYSFDQFVECIYCILNIGDEINSNVKKLERIILVTRIKIETDLDYTMINKIIDDISLSKRTNYLLPDPPFRKEDVYPWRFNRELSFTRRPLVAYDEYMIWGNRQLHHMLVFLVDTIIDGKLRAKGKKLSSLIGKLGDKRGFEFNEIVSQKLSEFNSVIVSSQVKKINRKKLCDEKNNTLGDLDVLCIVPNKKKIFVIEVKDFSFARDPYELNMEYQKMYVDKNGKLSYSSKHRKRVDWIKQHISDVIEHYSLKEGSWKVIELFIVNEDLVSNKYYKKGLNVMTFSEITEKKILSLK